MKNRIFAVVLAVIMTVCFLSISAAAQTTITSKVLVDLQGFGIVSGDENGSLNLDENVTRAEFCKMVSVMISGNTLDGVFQTRFNDVPDSHWAATYINQMAAYGLINGIDKNNFNPDGNITYEQAMKVLVIALGYESCAEAAGGYPVGYSSIGIELEIGKKVGARTGQPLLRSDVMMMIYNCLDVRLPEPIISNKKSGFVIGEETYRGMLSGNSYEGIRKLTGIITANHDSYIALPNSEIEMGEIELYGGTIDAAGTDAYDLLGQEATVYVYYSSELRGYRATAAAATLKNEVTDVNFDDVDYIDNDKVIVRIDGNKKTYTLDEANFVYNGAPARFDAIKNKLENGKMRLISNDGDSNIDVVIIESYISGIIESVSAEHNYITFKGQGPNGYKKVFADSDYEEDYYTRICNKDGEVVTLDEFSPDTTLSLFFDNTGILKMIRGGDEKTEGTVKAIDSDDSVILTIDENEYSVEKNADISDVLGKYVSAHLNFEGKIASIEIVKEYRKFGIIVAAAEKGVIGGNVQVKMLLPNPLAEQEEENEDPTADVEKALVARNSSVAVMDMADSVKINDDRYKGSDILPAVTRAIRNTGKGYLVVEYTLNAEGEIRTLKNPEEIGTMTTKTYNSKEKTFGKTVEGSAFGINEKTLSICVPRNIISSDDDYLAHISMSNGRSYRVAAYEYNDNTYCADLIVINETMTYETAGSITNASKAAVVCAVKVINLDDLTQITLLTQNGEETFVVSDHTGSSADFSALKKGDFIYYSLDMAGSIDGYKLISHSSPIPETGSYAQDTVYVGYVNNMRYNEVSNSLNCWVDTMEFVDDAGHTNTFEIRKTSQPPIYIYDTSSKTSYVGTTADLLRYHERVIVALNGQKVRAVLLIV